MRNRASEAFARLLDDRSPATGEGPAQLRALAAFADALRGTTPSADPAFKTELRAMLIEEARLQQAAAAAPRILPRVRAHAASTLERWRYSTRMAAASLATAMAFSGGGAVAVAAERALPGDALYAVKLALDEARATMRLDVVAEGKLHLDNAAERIDEAEHAATAGNQDGAAIALRESTDSARKGANALIDGYEKRGDQAIVHALETFADVQGRRVRVLARRLDGDAARAARSSLVVLERIEARLVAIGGCDRCAAEPPRSGEAFDFSEIPPADQPFQPCPCDEDDGADTDADRPRRPSNGAGDEPREDDPGRPPTDGPDDDDDDDVVPGLPEPVGDTVNQLLKGIVTKSAEKSVDGMPEDLKTPAAPVAKPALPVETPELPDVPAVLPMTPSIEP